MRSVWHSRDIHVKIQLQQSETDQQVAALFRMSFSKLQLFFVTIVRVTEYLYILADTNQQKF